MHSWLYVYLKVLYLSFLCVAPPVPPSVPPSVLPPDEQINQDPRTITIDVPNFSTAMGQISHYHIIVVFLPEGTNINDLSAPDEEFDSRGSLKNINLPCDNKPAGVSAYITAEMSNALYGDLNGKYVVGQDKDSDSNSPNDRPELYTNGPLCYSTRYTFFVRAYPVSTNAGVRRDHHSCSHLDAVKFNMLLITCKC